MLLFLSTFINKIDKKGRVSVPAQFRAVLRVEEFQGIVAYPSFINQCIEAAGMTRMEKITDIIEDLDPFSEEKDAFATAILGDSHQLSFDGEGRIILPEILMKNCGLTDKALFIGKGKNFEIWNPDQFESYSKQAKDFALKQRNKLTLKGRNDSEQKK
ncbi:MAG: cell division/cell wall cluster transcriptional repressor MraZ [Rickettsiales bacterium]|jgi:MraZ protein|nr:cell division/cell wall cluster transcriptional repressor MraZ [Rickettsiales bacterium]